MLKIPTHLSRSMPFPTALKQEARRHYRDSALCLPLFTFIFVPFPALFGNRKKKKPLSFLIHPTTALRYREWRMRCHGLLQVPCGPSFIRKHPSCTSLLFPSVLCHSSSHIPISTCMEIMAQGCREAQPRGHRYFGCQHSFEEISSKVKNTSIYIWIATRCWKAPQNVNMIKINRDLSAISLLINQS